MANTKKTAKKTERNWRCPVCFDTFETQESGDLHVLKCAKERMQATQFVCMITGCKYAGTRKSDLDRHMKRVHKEVVVESDSELEDPGNLSDILGDEVGSISPPVSSPIVSHSESPTMGRLFRKATNPTPVSAGIKKRLIDTLEPAVKTKQPHSAVSCNLQTTQYSPRALAKAPRTTHGEPIRTTSTPQLAQRQLSLGISIASTLSSYPDIRSPVIFSFPGDDHCQASMSTLSTPRVTSGLRQLSTELPKQSLTVDVSTQTGPRGRKHKTRKVTRYYEGNKSITYEEEEEWSD